MSSEKFLFHELIKRIGLDPYDIDAYTELVRTVLELCEKSVSRDLYPADKQEINSVLVKILYNIVKGAATYRGPTSPELDPQKTALAFIWRIVHNCIADYERELKKLDREVYIADIFSDSDCDNDPLEILLPTAQEVGNVEDHLVRKQEIQEIWDDLDHQERIVMDAMAHGYKLTTIAKILKVTPSRVSQIVRSIKEKAERRLW